MVQTYTKDCLFIVSTLSALLILEVPHVNGDLVCLSCQQAVKPRDCATITRCGANENCYTEAVLTTLGYVRYNMGCGSGWQCVSSSPVGRRSVDNGILVNTECCSSQLCNSNAFGINGNASVDLEGPLCYNCQEQARMHDCNQITLCTPDTVCRIQSVTNPITHDHLYSTGCAHRNVCSTRSSAETDCDTCCDTELCNDKCDIPTTPPHTVTSYPDLCASNPCVHGHCWLTRDSYLCKCPSGYRGIHCEIEAHTDLCLSNPCVNGQCQTTDQAYMCRCSPGYTGPHCETACQVDLIFMLGTSMNISHVEFMNEIQYVRNIVSYLDIGVQSAKVGLLVAGSSPQLQWNLNKYISKEETLSALSDVQFRNGVPRIDLALKYIRENMLQIQNGDRVSVKNVICILIDGISVYHQNTKAEARKLHTPKNIVFVMGIGQTPTMELLDIASDSLHAVMVDDYGDLPQAALASVLMMC